MTLKATIADRLKGRSELAYGEQTALARELGCSRIWVGVTVRELGILVARPERASCERCGKPIRLPRKTPLCGRCLRTPVLVTLTCVNCGKRFRRRLHAHKRFLAREVTEGRRGPVCGRDCHMRFERTCAWCGRVSTRSRRRDRRLGFCGPPRKCLSKAMLALPVMHWRFLTPDLLPMQDHRAQIGRLRESIPTD